jgi:hypothetical protein
VRAKQRRGEGAAQERGLNQSVAKTSAKERGLNQAVVTRAAKERESNKSVATTTAAERNMLNQRRQRAMRSEQRGYRNAPGHGEAPVAGFVPGRSPGKKQSRTSQSYLRRGVSRTWRGA